MTMGLLAAMNRTQLEEGPALAPPPGVHSNFDHPPNGNSLVHGVAIISLFFTIAAVTIRAYSTICLTRRVKPEDLLIFAGFGVYIGFNYGIYRIIHGIGFYVHLWDVRMKDSIDFAYVAFVGSLLYGVVIACLKTAILLEWIRIFVPRPKKNGLYYACWAIIALNIVFYVSYIIIYNLACFPYHYIWDKTIQGGHCAVSGPLLDLLAAIVNLVVDLAILILPQQAIWRLHMSTKKKIGLSLTFAIGVFGCVSAIFRIIVTFKFSTSEDLSYRLSPVALWAYGELTSAFLIACVPAAPRVFTGEGVVARITSRLASLIGLSRHKPSSSNRPSSWVRDDGSKRKKYKGLYDNDTLLLDTVASTRGNQPSSDSLERPQDAHLSDTPRILRTTEIRLEEVSEDNNGGAKVEDNMHTRQYPWDMDRQEI